MHPKIYTPFNPKVVYEFKDGKFIRKVENWNRSIGILYNVSFYHLDEDTYYQHCLTVKNYQCLDLGAQIKHQCDIFIIDNYLNLYDMNNDIYFMFNKIPFPKSSLISLKMQNSERDLSHLLYTSFESTYYEDGDLCDATLNTLCDETYLDMYDKCNAYRNNEYFESYKDHLDMRIKQFHEETEKIKTNLNEKLKQLNISNYSENIKSTDNDVRKNSITESIDNTYKNLNEIYEEAQNIGLVEKNQLESDMARKLINDVIDHVEQIYSEKETNLNNEKTIDNYEFEPNKIRLNKTNKKVVDNDIEIKELDTDSDLESYMDSDTSSSESDYDDGIVIIR